MYSGGGVRFSVSTVFRVSGNLYLGDDFFLGANSKLLCDYSIKIADVVHFAFECVITDTNFHPLLNVDSGIVLPFFKEIVIGSFVWVGNRTSIMPGCVLPKYSVVASNSLLNKDYSQNVSYPLIAGIPGKIVKSGLMRIFNLKAEKNLGLYFKNNNNAFKFITYYAEELAKPNGCQPDFVFLSSNG